MTLRVGLSCAASVHPPVVADPRNAPTPTPLPRFQAHDHGPTPPRRHRWRTADGRALHARDARHALRRVRRPRPRSAPPGNARPGTDACRARASSLLRARALPAPLRARRSGRSERILRRPHRPRPTRRPGKGPLADGEGETAQGGHRQVAQGCGVSHLARTIPTGGIRRAVTLRVFPRGVQGACHPAMVGRTQVLSGVSRRVLDEEGGGGGELVGHSAFVGATSFSPKASGEGAGGEGLARWKWRSSRDGTDARATVESAFASMRVSSQARGGE